MSLSESHAQRRHRQAERLLFTRLLGNRQTNELGHRQPAQPRRLTQTAQLTTNANTDTATTTGATSKLPTLV